MSPSHEASPSSVGRQNEMAALQGALEQAIAGNVQVVGVVAEAGTGKSRLCYEFAEHCRARDIPVYEAHGASQQGRELLHQASAVRSLMVASPRTG